MIIFIAAFFSSILTFISGFGLNTILMPIFAIFVPVYMAIAFSAIVFCFYNFIRSVLSYKYISFKLVLFFFPFSFVGILLGSYALRTLANLSEQSLEIIIGILLAVIATLEATNILKKINFKKYVFVGAFLSGLIGGFSGHQGPVRVTTLLSLNLGYKEFIANNSAIGFMIDIIRVIIYLMTLIKIGDLKNPLLIYATIGAISGMIFGYRFLKNVNMKIVRIVVIITIYIFSVLLMFGFNIAK